MTTHLISCHFVYISQIGNFDSYLPSCNIKQLTKMLTKEMQQLLKQKQLLFATAMSKLHTLSPLKTMERGYSLVYDKEKELIKSTKQVSKGDVVNVRLTDGQLQCEVSKIEER